MLSGVRLGGAEKLGIDSQVKTNPAGIDLIKSFESCRLTAYQCPAGIWTIGYGSTENVTPGMEITQAEADQRLCSHLSTLESQVSNLLKWPVNPNQFSAVVSFSYNCGVGNLKSSTLLNSINKGRLTDAAEEFLKWNKIKGISCDGLTRRRQAERALFLTG